MAFKFGANHINFITRQLIDVLTLFRQSCSPCFLQHVAYAFLYYIQLMHSPVPHQVTIKMLGLVSQLDWRIILVLGFVKLPRTVFPAIL